MDVLAVYKQRFIPSLLELVIIVQQLSDIALLYLQHTHSVPGLGLALGVLSVGEIVGVKHAADASYEVE